MNAAGSVSIPVTVTGDGFSFDAMLTVDIGMSVPESAGEVLRTLLVLDWDTTRVEVRT